MAKFLGDEANVSRADIIYFIEHDLKPFLIKNYLVFEDESDEETEETEEFVTINLPEVKPFPNPWAH